jgi:hypothetical protein
MRKSRHAQNQSAADGMAFSSTRPEPVGRNYIAWVRLSCDTRDGATNTLAFQSSSSVQRSSEIEKGAAA